MTKKVLLIEDDVDFQNLIKAQTEELQLELTIASDGETGLPLALGGDYALAIIDVSLPGMNGFDICRAIRAHDDTMQIMFLTSRGEEIDRVLGLELGADDYIVKPGSMRELCSRIRMLLKRYERLRGIEAAPGKDAESTEMRLGDLVVDRVLRRLLRNGERIDLTPIQYRLFDYLLSNPDRVCTREELIEDVWGKYAYSYEATLTKNMSRLRTRIESDPEGRPLIITLQGVGYRLGDQVRK